MDECIVDGVVLDKDNQLFFDAARIIMETDHNVVYLTGKAGTGKTTFLKYIKSKYSGSSIILAPTGVAAINAGGQTIHSFFKFALTCYIPNDHRLTKGNLRYDKPRIQIIQRISLLIIDEISMVRCDILDAINSVLQLYRGNLSPFGGVKVLLIGDTFQLPPITQPLDWNILSKYYKSFYFFSAKIYEKSNPLYIELEKPYRQSEQEFIDILNNVRVNNLSKDDLFTINSRLKYNKTEFNGKEEPIMLAPKNRIVDEHNKYKFSLLNTEINEFVGVVSGIFPKTMMIADDLIELRIGSQVMILKNKYMEQEFNYYNGAIGVITNINDEERTVEVKLKDKTVNVSYATWENIEYVLKDYSGEKRIEQTIIGKYSQIPLRLAWAITIHKSQGLTFDSVVADLSECFDYGQVYVALSRCRKMNGLFLKSPVTEKSVKTDEKVVEFAKSKTPHTILVKEIEKGKGDNLYKLSRQAFYQNDLEATLNYLNEAVKVRDDRDSKIFKKFLRVNLSLFSYLREVKKKYETSIETVEYYKNECNSAIHSLNELKEDFAIYVNEIELVIQQKDEIIDTLIREEGERIENHVIEKESLQLEIRQSKDLMKENDLLMRKTKQLEDSLNKREIIVSNLKADLKYAKLEASKITCENGIVIEQLSNKNIESKEVFLNEKRYLENKIEQLTNMINSKNDIILEINLQLKNIQKENQELESQKWWEKLLNIK